MLVARALFPPAPAPPPRTAAEELPQGLEAFATGFAVQYLTPVSDQSMRAAGLASFASPDLASQLAATQRPAPDQRVLFAVPSSVMRKPGGFIVTVALRISSGSAGRPDRWMWLAVPVAAQGDALVVANWPAVVHGPERVSIPAPLTDVADPALSERAQSVLSRFFSLYLGERDPSELPYLLAPGADVGSPPRIARWVTLVDVAAQRHDSNQVTALVRLIVRDVSGARWSLGYQVTLADSGGRLEVAELSPIAPRASLER